MNIETLKTCNVRRLTIREKPLVQTETINGLKEHLGDESSRDVVERATFEVSDRLNRLESALLQGDLNKSEKLATSMITISEQIGLGLFANVARDLIDTIRHNDFVATAAISRRLARQGEEALLQVVNFDNSPKCS